MGVVSVLKGDVRGTETVVSDSGSCGSLHLQVGQPMRIYGARTDDGNVWIHGCASRSLEEEEVRALRPASAKPPPPPPAATPDAVAATRAPATKGCGCAAADDPGAAAALVLLALVVTRRRSSAAGPRS
jgi:MYXO-CTERM domain-containing protein